MVPNIPTALTWLRIILIPVFVGIYYAPDELLSQVMRNWVGMSIFSFGRPTRGTIRRRVYDELH